MIAKHKIPVQFQAIVHSFPYATEVFIFLKWMDKIHVSWWWILLFIVVDHGWSMFRDAEEKNQ